MPLSPNPDDALHPKEDFSVFCDGLDHPEGLAFDDEQALWAGGPEVYAENMARISDGLALDAAGNLYVTCYASECIYRVSQEGNAEMLAFDPKGTRIARPTNAAFGGPAHDDLYIANLGWWHIGRVHVGVPGQLLTNLDRAGATPEVSKRKP